jgi:hypothetical protein
MWEVGISRELFQHIDSLSKLYCRQGHLRSYPADGENLMRSSEGIYKISTFWSKKREASTFLSGCFQFYSGTGGVPHFSHSRLHLSLQTEVSAASSKEHSQQKHFGFADWKHPGLKSQILLALCSFKLLRIRRLMRTCSFNPLHNRTRSCPQG